MKNTLLAILLAASVITVTEAAVPPNMDLDTYCGFIERTAELVQKGRMGGMNKADLLKLFESHTANLREPSRLMVELAYQLDVDEMEPFPELVKVMCLKGHFR